MGSSQKGHGSGSGGIALRFAGRTCPDRGRGSDEREILQPRERARVYPDKCERESRTRLSRSAGGGIFVPASVAEFREMINARWQRSTATDLTMRISVVNRLRKGKVNKITLLAQPVRAPSRFTLQHQKS